MTEKQLANAFIEDSVYAIRHIFDAIEQYNNICVHSKQNIEDIQKAQSTLKDLFIFRDQFSPDANHHYALYMSRLEKLKEWKKKLEDKSSEELISEELLKINASVISMAILAGTILQIAKQTLSIRYMGHPTILEARKIGNQSIIEVIWEGRNHSMHWETKPRRKVEAMLDALEQDLGVVIDKKSNNCLIIIEALGWKTAEDVIEDLHALNE